MLDLDLDLYKLCYSLDMLKASMSVLLLSQPEPNSLLSQIEQLHNFSKTIWLSNQASVRSRFQVKLQPLLSIYDKF